MKKSVKITLCIIGGILILLVGATAVYSLDYYEANDEQVKQAEQTEGISVQYSAKGYVIVAPNGNYDTAYIFYPGGKVEHTAYLPFAVKIALKCNIAVIIPQMPLKLAVLNSNAADKIMQDFPQITTWYIGGHSLGGAMASNYYVKNQDKIDGLILVGSYEMQICPNVISLYGSNDNVLDRGKGDLSANVKVIEGGNHAYFGNYGTQEGDGTATITREQQQNLAADEIYNFLITEEEQ